MVNNQFQNPWEKSEIEILKSIYPKLFVEEIPIFFPERTTSAVLNKAKSLGIKKELRKIFNYKNFTKDYDGGYVSGFVDGEGSFVVSLKHTKNKNGKFLICNQKLTINLRRDDLAILNYIKDYFDAGHICLTKKTGQGNGKPQASFSVSSLYEIVSKIIPHFDKYPLQAKKQNDFLIWKEIVNLQISNYRKRYDLNYHNKMLGLCEDLKNIRVYDNVLFGDI